MSVQPVHRVPLVARPIRPEGGPPLRPNAAPGAKPFFFKRGWIRGAIGGQGVEVRTGPTTVVYAGAERVLDRGGPGRTLDALHEAVRDALARVAKNHKWSPEGVTVAFAERSSRRLGFAWRPGASRTGMRVICLDRRTARAATRALLVFTVAHELLHHWREEQRAARPPRSSSHDKVFCDALRQTAGDLSPVKARCAKVKAEYDPALDTHRPAPIQGVLRVTVTRRGWRAIWEPSVGARRPVEVADARALAKLARGLTPEQRQLAPVTYEGSRRTSFARPSTLAGFLQAIAATGRVARDRRLAR